MQRSQIVFRLGAACAVFLMASAIVTSAQSALAERRAAKHALMLAKYDRNGDGQISREERRLVKAEARAERAASKAARAQAKAEAKAAKAQAKADAKAKKERAKSAPVGITA